MAVLGFFKFRAFQTNCLARRWDLLVVHTEIVDDYYVLYILLSMLVHMSYVVYTVCFFGFPLFRYAISPNEC